jgi:hypothetical protein
MAGLEHRLAEAGAALASRDEAVANAGRSIIERDRALLRLIDTFAALWKACWAPRGVSATAAERATGFLTGRNRPVW